LSQKRRLVSQFFSAEIFFKIITSFPRLILIGPDVVIQHGATKNRFLCK
jgi:hypothetical protein